MLPAGILERRNSASRLRAGIIRVHYTTSRKHSLVLLNMGEIIARNMLN